MLEQSSVLCIVTFLGEYDLFYQTTWNHTFSLVKHSLKTLFKGIYIAYFDLSSKGLFLLNKSSNFFFSKK